jgi:hypothetical protein
MVVTISKTGWDALSTKERKVFKFVQQRLQLGEPAIYVDGGAGRHYTFSDSRIDLLDMAVLGSFAANRADLPGAYEVPLDGEGNVDKPQLRSDIQAWLTNPARTHPFVHPNNVTPADEDVGVTPQDVLSAQNTPAAVGAEIDPSWVPYDPETHGAV